MGASMGDAYWGTEIIWRGGAMVTDRDAQVERIVAAIKGGSIGPPETQSRRVRRRVATYSGVQDIVARFFDGDALARYELAHRDHVQNLRADAERNHQQVVAASTECRAADIAAAAARRNEIAQLPLNKWEFIEPFLIWQSPGGLSLDEATIAPGNSAAKFHFHADNDGGGDRVVTFWFFWDNNQFVPVMVNLFGTIQANGFVRAGANGVVFGNSYCDVSLDVYLGVVQPPLGQGGVQASQSHELQSVMADASGFLTLGNL
jgi:hypothetical protein